MVRDTQSVVNVMICMDVHHGRFFFILLSASLVVLNENKGGVPVDFFMFFRRNAALFV